MENRRRGYWCIFKTFYGVCVASCLGGRDAREGLFVTRNIAGMEQPVPHDGRAAFKKFTRRLPRIMAARHTTYTNGLRDGATPRVTYPSRRDAVASLTSRRSGMGYAASATCNSKTNLRKKQ